ncbi:hypothetical protein BKH46_05835 [Helicobacter sp. 12S02634-8]|uniref:type II and III secretion system protein family protein n=1 Tax=Helicobacter sp. 12S02634-8 TaxID=1476199 RepID=UPI000BA5F159|nr:pilus assembly protein N-terminal domain-containing protein [Helicobacter sp. 12S02634-8]PAF46956.1 hypothetical protein BKH46_05835 [Helicobacter sp. 12S02634-8]
MHRLISGLLFCLCGVALWGGEILMKKGDSRVFKTTMPISAVFASDPKALDYKIIDSHQVVVYANDNGYADIRIFGSKANKDILLFSASITIDPLAPNLKKIEELIEGQIAGAKIKLTKLGLPGEQGYVISGIVPDEGSRDSAYRMAALALGAELEKKEKNPASADRTSQRIGGEGEQQDNPLLFLTRYESDFLVDKMNVALSSLVNVKLLVVDVEKNLIGKLGFDFNGGSIALPLVNSGGFGLSQFNFAAVIDALKDNQIAKILAEPNLSVLSGEDAHFSVTGQYTPITNTVTFGGRAVSSPGTAKDYGISLTIQPKVESSGKITVRISQEVSNIQSIIERNGASAANLKKRRAESVIQVADGESFVVGGLLDERDNENVRSVPFLGDIPILGALFRKTNITRSKMELIVIATVSLAKPVTKDVFAPAYQPRTLMESFFDLPYKNTRDDGLELRAFVQNIGFMH